MIAISDAATARWYLELLLLVALVRMIELRIADRHRRQLLARGGFEVGATHYPWMVALHVSFLFACGLEVVLARRPFLPWLGIPMLVLLGLAAALRVWVMRSLGVRWTTRVIVLPGEARIAAGPYRFIRHPNYLAVAVEMAALPLVHTAWITAVVWSALNGVLLRRRIRVEDAALTDVEILAQIADLAHRELQWHGALRPEQRLIEDLGLDSLRLMALAVAVENRFEVSLEPEDEAGLITVGDLVRIVRRKGAR